MPSKIDPKRLFVVLFGSLLALPCAAGLANINQNFIKLETCGLIVYVVSTILSSGSIAGFYYDNLLFMSILDLNSISHYNNP